MNDATKIDDRAAAWVVREDKAPLEAELAQQRDAWLTADPRHRGAYLRAHAVFLRAGRASALGYGFGQGASTQARPRMQAARRGWMALATAAVLGLVVIGLPRFSATPGTIDYHTARGEVLRVPLQDGSVLTLNSDTDVSVHYSDDARTVTLRRGETLFDVAKDRARPFTVKTGATDVVAVGTSFSVRKTTGDAFTLLVNEGVVDIRQPKERANALRIRANFAAVAKRGNGVRVEPLSQYEVRRRLAWRVGLISFEGTTLADAATEFSRYSDVRIVIDDPSVAERRVVGVYSSADPEGFATTVAASLGLQVEKKPDGVHLRASW